MAKVFVKRGLAVVLAGLVSAATGAAVLSYQHRGAVHRLLHPPRDLAVAGRAAPQTGNLETWLLALSDGDALGDVTVSSGDDHLALPASSLGFAIDVERTVTRLQLAVPRPTAMTRLRRAFFPAPVQVRVEPAVRLDAAVARRRLEALAKDVRRAPVDAALDVERYLRIDDVPGRELDVEATLARLSQHRLGKDFLSLAFREVPARIKSADLSPVDVSLVLSSFETDFRKKAGRRALNIRRAAELLDGAVIEPGAIFSFNRVVGDRTERNGFVWAPVIVNDEMEPGVGGGVCQVASTLHAAAVLGGLDIKQRRSHSRPSGYAPLGLDAAVIYGQVDLELQNPFSVPLMVRAFLPSEFVIRVEFLGAKNPNAIEHSHAVVARYDFYRRIVEDPVLAPGQFELRQDGGYGYDVVSVIEHHAPDGSRTSRRYSSKYYPVPEVYAVGPGTSPSELPELPEGAVDVQRVASVDEELGMPSN